MDQSTYVFRAMRLQCRERTEAARASMLGGTQDIVDYSAVHVPVIRQATRVAAAEWFTRESLVIINDEVRECL